MLTQLLERVAGVVNFQNNTCEGGVLGNILNSRRSR